MGFLRRLQLATSGVATQINTTIERGMFKNLALTVEGYQSFTSYNYAPVLTPNGYPKNGTLGTSISGTLPFPSNLVTSDQMVLKWTGTGTIFLGRGAPGFTIVSDTGGWVSGSAAFNMTVAGANPRVVFTFTTSVPESVQFNFVSGETYTNMAGLVLCKLSDEAAIDAATTPEAFFSDDYVNLYKALKVAKVRPLGYSGINGSNVSQSRYLPAWQTSLNMCSERWEPGAIAADIGGGAMCTTGTDTYLCGAQPDATGGYVDGEMIHVKFVNANTSTTVTVNSGGRGAKRVGWHSCASYPFQDPEIGQITAGMLTTLTYDALLGIFLLQPGGQSQFIPYELQIAFANRLNADIWLQFPAYFDNASTTATATLTKNNLLTNLNAYFEYLNEVWNPGAFFPGTRWSIIKGQKLGFPADNNRRPNGWYSLRLRQMMGLVTTAWAGSTSRLRRVIAFQAFGDTVAGSLYRLQGADLNSTSFPDYGTYTGGVNYDTAPNRPVDFCDSLSYATYYSGAQCPPFDQNYIDQGAAGIADLLTAADNYASGVPASMASALAFMESDVRAGVIGGTSTAGNETLLSLKSLAYGSGIYPSWEAVAASFALSVDCYEGCYQGWWPTIGTCTSLGISTTYGGPTGKIAVLLDAFKKTDAFKNVVRDQVLQFMAHPHSRTASWFLLAGAPQSDYPTNQWSMSTGDAFATKYKSFDAIAALNGA